MWNGARTIPKTATPNIREVGSNKIRLSCDTPDSTLAYKLNGNPNDVNSDRLVGYTKVLRSEVIDRPSVHFNIACVRRGFLFTIVHYQTLS